MLYREIIAVCSEIHTEHINTLCGQNEELLCVKLVVHIVTTGLYMVKHAAFRRTPGGVSQPAQSACSYWRFFLTTVVWTVFLGDWRAYNAVSGRVEPSFMSSIFVTGQTACLHTTARFPSFITLFIACSFFPFNLSNQSILISKGIDKRRSDSENRCCYCVMEGGTSSESQWAGWNEWL
jgi:hypothetical protein